MKTEVVKQFIAKSKSIKPNTIIPALSCIKAQCIGENLVLTKSSLDAWLVEVTPVAKKFDVVILFEEKPLNAYLSISKDEDINLSIKGNKVSMHAGSNTIEFTMIDAKEYPLAPVIEMENILQHVFTGDEADALHMACAFVKKDATGHPLENIFVVDGFIYASDGFYGLRYPTGAPDMAISPQCAAVVQDGSMYMKSGNYTCIVSPDGSTRHLFISSEATAPGFKAVFKQGEKISTINTAELVTGLRIVQQMANEKLVIAEIGDGRILYKEDAYGTMLDYSITTGNFTAKINASLTLPLLMALPQTDYDVHQVAPGIFYLNDGDLYIFFTTIQN